MSHKEFSSAVKLCKSSFIHVGFFSLCVNVLMLVPALYMLQLYDRVISSGSSSTLLMLTILMILLLVAMGLMDWTRVNIMQKLSNQLNQKLTPLMYDISFQQALYSSKQTVALPVKDLNGVRQFLSSNGLFAFFDTPWVPVYVLIMFLFHPWIGMVAVFSIVILFGLTLLNEKITKPIQSKAQYQLSKSAESINKSLINAEVIQSMGMLNSVRDRWNKQNIHANYTQSRSSEYSSIISNISKTFRIIVQSLILGVGAYLAIQQEISPGVMIAGSILLGRALAPIDQMIGVWKGFIDAREQYARLKNAVSMNLDSNDKLSLPSPQGDILIEDLYVTPPGGKEPVLKGLSFHVPAGSVVGIIGNSASGKTTFARAVLGIWPSLKGRVCIDNADILNWNKSELGPYIGYLPQNVELFDGSVKDNIARMGKVNDQEVIKAAKLVGIHEMILSLPEGYDTFIDQSGGHLSGGQRQRLGLARALYGSPKLVVLDEPNSHLDQQGEVSLVNALLQLKAMQTTVFIITHKLSVLEYVDKIMLLNDGVLAMYGPKDKVLSALNQVESHA